MRTDETVHSEGSCIDDSPTYRVNFWEGDGKAGWNLQAFVLSETNSVQEVIDWVRMHENGRRVELFVEVDDVAIHSFDTPRKANLIRLYGANPNEDVEPLRFNAFD